MTHWNLVPIGIELVEKTGKWAWNKFGDDNKHNKQTKLLMIRNIEPAVCREIGGEPVDNSCFLELESRKDSLLVRRPHIEVL